MVQIKFLQSLHDKAEQEITFHCKNSVAYRDAQSGSKDRAILLTTFNGDWLGANSKKKFRYKVTEDGCQVTASSHVYLKHSRTLTHGSARGLYFIMFHFLFKKGERWLMGENCVWGKNEEDQQITYRGYWHCRHRATRSSLQSGSWTCLFFVISELMLWSG